MSGIRLETSKTESGQRMLSLSKFKPSYSQSHADRNVNHKPSQSELAREKRQANYNGKSGEQNQ